MPNPFAIKTRGAGTNRLNPTVVQPVGETEKAPDPAKAAIKARLKSVQDAKKK